MHEKQAANTLNGHEITPTSEKLEASEFKNMLVEYGLVGNNPEERVEALKQLSAENIAIMITDINRRLQGSEETLVHEKTMKIGDQSVVPVEYRYDLFQLLIKKISESPQDTNPERIADALSLGIVLLHPFKDGNGRTSRALRLAFDNSFDTEEYEGNFNFLTESRDQSRERGGDIAVGYVPHFKEGQDQSDPEAVEDYFRRLLTEEDPSLYTGPAQYAQLKKPEPALA